MIGVDDDGRQYNRLGWRVGKTDLIVVISWCLSVCDDRPNNSFEEQVPFFFEAKNEEADGDT